MFKNLGSGRSLTKGPKLKNVNSIRRSNLLSSKLVKDERNKISQELLKIIERIHLNYNLDLIDEDDLGEGEIVSNILSYQ